MIIIKNLVFTIFTFFIASQMFGQNIKVSDNLTLYKLSKHSYIHTQKNNNGLVYINQGEAIIVSTPNSDIETQNLIDYVKNEQKAKIIGYIIDRWHPDAMEGLDIVKKNGIKSYSYKLTRTIAKEKGLPIPDIGFDPKLELKISGNKVVCHFLGEAHTKDGIVVWIPGEQILFGGNEIRNYKGWVGNIGDANLDKWPKTAKKIKREYGSAKIVVPGHGKYGGSELIDYTIDLFSIPKNESITDNRRILIPLNLKIENEFNIKAEFDSIQDGKRFLRNANVIVQDETKFIVIESPQVIISHANKRIDSKVGRVKIYDKKAGREELRTDVNYKKIIVYKYDDTIGFVVILKEIENNNR